MSYKFKNIILFSPTNEKTTQLKDKLQAIKFIKVFVTDIIDEVQQIIDMSDKAVILVDDDITANKVFKATLNKKKARFKKFYMNWYPTISKAMSENVFEQDFTLIYSPDVDSVIDRVELYLFGRANIFNNPNYSAEAEPEKKVLFKKGYFTHLENINGIWKILISSHETDDEIDEMLGKNWDAYLQSLLKKANDLDTLTEAKLETAAFHELVYPHKENGKINKLSIVHLNLDEHFASNIMNIHGFLKNL